MLGRLSEVKLQISGIGITPISLQSLKNWKTIFPELHVFFHHVSHISDFMFHNHRMLGKSVFKGILFLEILPKAEPAFLNRTFWEVLSTKKSFHLFTGWNDGSVATLRLLASFSRWIFISFFQGAPARKDWRHRRRALARAPCRPSSTRRRTTRWPNWAKRSASSARSAASRRRASPGTRTTSPSEPTSWTTVSTSRSAMRRAPSKFAT